MVDSRACGYCAKFRSELADVYARSAPGQVAPLRRVSAFKKWPADLAGVTRTPFAPVFIVVDDGREVGRFAGYNGAEGFWNRLEPLIARLN